MKHDRLRKLTLHPPARTTATFALLVLTASMPAAARSVRPHPRVCQHQHGRTILRRGIVRVFSASGNVYGCVNGSTRRVWLWETSNHRAPSPTASLTQIAGQFVAVESSFSDQYEYDHSVEVFNLRSGASYSIGSEREPINGGATGKPPTPGPWPLEAFALGPDGRVARLYDTFAASASPSYIATPTGQVLDLIGLHHLRRQLATSAPGGIPAASIAYHNHTVTWTQDGSQHAASV